MARLFLQSFHYLLAMAVLKEQTQVRSGQKEDIYVQFEITNPYTLHESFSISFYLKKIK